MPILVRELHLKVNLNSPATDGGGSLAIKNQAKKTDTTDENRDALIAECVEQVLEILKTQNEA